MLNATPSPSSGYICSRVINMYRDRILQVDCLMPYTLRPETHYHHEAQNILDIYTLLIVCLHWPKVLSLRNNLITEWLLLPWLGDGKTESMVVLTTCLGAFQDIIEINATFYDIMPKKLSSTLTKWGKSFMRTSGFIKRLSNILWY